jgi:DNA-binding CsgD family transcriptional regulator
MSTALTIILAFLLLFALPAIVLGWITESKRERVHRWRRAGMSQRKIADRLGCSRYAVRRILKVA